MADNIKKPESKDLLNHIINEYAPLINLHVKKLSNEGRIPHEHDVSELHMAGLHGLMHSLKNYNPDLGIKFSTYANNTIRGHMLANIAATKDVPRTLQNQARRLKEKDKALSPVTTITPDIKKPEEE